MTPALRNVCVDGFNIKHQCDAIFLDLPAPWIAMPHVIEALKPGVVCRLVSFSPCIEQTQVSERLLTRLRASKRFSNFARRFTPPISTMCALTSSSARPTECVCSYCLRNHLFTYSAIIHDRTYSRSSKCSETSEKRRVETLATSEQTPPRAQATATSRSIVPPPFYCLRLTNSRRTRAI